LPLNNKSLIAIYILTCFLIILPFVIINIPAVRALTIERDLFILIKICLLIVLALFGFYYIIKNVIKKVMRNKEVRYSFETNTKKMFEKILKKDEKVKSKTIYKEKHG